MPLVVYLSAQYNVAPLPRPGTGFWCVQVSSSVQLFDRAAEAPP
ncbi:MAG TPA: hypothetical protein VME46_19925 [Acidimicrobiales bacterium]|nr:hypothetical protein [Acidimicrobiales bacterium]